MTTLTFYILFLLAGSGPLGAMSAPALMRFDDLQSCEAAAKALRKKWVVQSAECIRVTVERKTAQ